MPDVSFYIVPLITGMVLGAFFSFNLWASIKKMTDQNTPWYYLYGNFFIRMMVVLTGLFIVMQGRWERLVAAVIGFAIVREVLVRTLGSNAKLSS